MVVDVEQADHSTKPFHVLLDTGSSNLALATSECADTSCASATEVGVHSIHSFFLHSFIRLFMLAAVNLTCLCYQTLTHSLFSSMPSFFTFTGLFAARRWRGVLQLEGLRSLQPLQRRQRAATVRFRSAVCHVERTVCAGHQLWWRQQL
jgi:hypothetical protein